MQSTLWRSLDYLCCQYLLDYLIIIHKEVMLHHWEHFNLYVFIFMSSRVLFPHHTWHCKRTHYFSSTRDDKINDCGFKFSVACEWHVLIEEDKDNLFQYAKVFPIKFLKLPICQSFTPPPFCAIQYFYFTWLHPF